MAASGALLRGDWRAAAILVCAAVTLCAAADCGASATGVDTCKQVEEARCRRAAACGFSTQPPYFTNGTDVEACIRHYDVACLHGTSVAVPAAAQVSACLMAIQTAACDGGGAPPFEADPACDWLTQNQPVEAGPASSSDAGDAGGE
jgi:hypothetical protein